jgi:hypothetical protein
MKNNEKIYLIENLLKEIGRWKTTLSEKIGIKPSSLATYFSRKDVLKNPVKLEKYTKAFNKCFSKQLNKKYKSEELFSLIN